MEQLQFVIPTLFGLESVCAQELRRLNLSDIQAENGRVLCKGALSDIPRLNLNLRTGERVLLSLGSFPAETFDALFEGTKALPLAQFIPKEGAFPVKGFCLNSKLQSVPSCQAIIKKASAASLGAVYGMETLPETGALYQIQFSIMKDVATIMLDTTGSGLYKRGYRAKGVDAPMRETLAAGLVLLSGYRGLDPFVDPFCGSGTIAIEAALIARNRAPGLERSFSSQKWHNQPSALWMDAASEAMDKEFDRTYEIHARDIDENATRLALSNAQLAGVDDTITFSVADAATFSAWGDYGRVVTNPPYGERLMEKSQAQAIYRAFGKAWKHAPEGWRLFLLSSHTEFEQAFGMTATKKRKLYNGMIKCDLFSYHKK